MSKQLLLPQDPRWLQLRNRYLGRPDLFAKEVQGIWLSSQQEVLHAAVAVSRARVSVVSGHGTGKTTSIANLVLWHLFCYENSVTLLTANDVDQLRATVWKEIGLAISRIQQSQHFGWLANYITILQDGTCHIDGFKSTWFVETKTANDKTANKLAGRHGKWFFIIADEASSLADNVLTTLTGALTEQHNRMLLTSQGTRNQGFFYKTHHELSKFNGGAWTSLSFSSFDSPFVDTKFLAEKLKQYDADEQRVRLHGQFIENSAKFFMNRAVAESMYTRGKIIAEDEPYGWLLLADIASGEGGERDSSTCVIAKVIGWGDYGEMPRRVEIHFIPIVANNIKANVYAHYLLEQGIDFSNVTHVCDAGGLGINVCQDLESLNAIVYRVVWSKPCFKKTNADRYINQRAQATHFAARAAAEGRLSILTHDYKNLLLSQASRIPRKFGNRGRIQVPEKGGKDWEGLKSPDLWDAICFAFLDNLEYIPASKKEKVVKTTKYDKAWAELDVDW